MDTNVVLRFLDADDPFHEVVVAEVSGLMDAGIELGITPQVIREVWCVCTRPSSVNGLGLEPPLVESLVQSIEKTFSFWDDRPGIAYEWRRLVALLSIRGVQVHDANHAAAALSHGATHVLTLNAKDFDRFRPFGLEQMSPAPGS